MSKKKLLAINLNEFNLNFLKYGAKKYNCKNINKFYPPTTRDGYVWNDEEHKKYCSR